MEYLAHCSESERSAPVESTPLPAPEGFTCVLYSRATLVTPTCIDDKCTCRLANYINNNDINNIHWGSSPHPFYCWWWSTNDYYSIGSVRATGGWHTCLCLVFFFDAPLHGLVFG